MTMGRRGKGCAADGQALVLVLWLIGMVSIAVGAVTMRATHELRLARVPVQRVVQRALAEAGLHQAIAVLQADAPEVDSLHEPWATGFEGGQPALGAVRVGQGTVIVGEMEDGELRAGLMDEERKLNVNTADLATLARLLQAVGPPETDAGAVAAAIGDWRSEAVGEVCAAADPPCHNGPLDSVEELALVPGMTPALYAAAAPVVTVYSSGVVNANTAPAVVLDALGYPGETWVAQRAHEPFSESPDPGNPALAITSTVFALPITATAEGSAVPTRLRILVTREGRVVAWLPQ